MFCENCGERIPDHSKFCPVCGQRISVHEEVESAAPETVDGMQADGTANLQDVPADMNRGRSGKKGLIALIAALVVVLAAACAGVFFFLHRQPTIDFNKYIEISCEGYNSIGTASYTFDWDQFEKDNGDKLKTSADKVKKALEQSDFEGAEALQQLLALYPGDSYEAIAKVLNSMSISDLYGMGLAQIGTLTPDTDLSNGDTVTFTWSGEESDKEAWEFLYGVKVKWSDITQTVDDLEEVDTFDAFEGVEITYSGYAPDASVQNISSGQDEACKNLTYTVEDGTALSNGDTITITISGNGSDWQEQMVQQYGKLPDALTKEFAVSGVLSYVSSADEISDDALQQMQAQAEDALKADVAETDQFFTDFDTDEELKAIEYLGNYFLTAKSDSQYGARNKLYLVYKVQVYNTYNDTRSYDAARRFEKTTDYYWYCQFSDIAADENGDCVVDLADYETLNRNSDDAEVEIRLGGNGNLYWTAIWDYTGYTDLDTMYDKVVTEQLADYSGTDNVTDVDLGGSPADDDASSEESDAGEDDGQILSYSSERALTEDDLDGLSKEEIQTAINEIYARHGYTFRDETILAHFKEYDWYEPTIAADDFKESVFSQMEKDNIALMREHLK